MANSPSVGYTTSGQQGQAFNLTGDTEHIFSAPCTQNVEHGERCWLVDRTREVNAVLLDIGVELHEALRAKGDDDVSLAFARSACGYDFDCGKSPHRKKAWLFAEELVSKHPCITATEIRARAKCHPSLPSVLMNNRSLKSLTIYGARTRILFGWLDFWCDSPVGDCDDRGAVHDLLCVALELRLKHLTTLDVAELSMSPVQASRFILALMTNSSVVDLAVNDCVFCLGEGDSGVRFASYLTKENCRLKRLVLKSVKPSCAYTQLPTLAEAVCKMKRLEDLNVAVPTWGGLFTRTTGLFADVVARNSTLRRLQLLSENEFSSWPDFYAGPVRLHSDAAQLMKHWLKALRSPNSALNELRINLKGFGLEECRAFLEAVAENKVLKLVALQAVPAEVDVEELCETIREFRLSDRVIILNHEVDEESVKVLPRCLEISCVTVRLKNLPFFVEENFQPISSPYGVLSRCAHVKSIRAHSEDLCHGSLMSSLTTYIRGATSLTDVEVDLNVFGFHLRGRDRRYLETELMAALASNTRLVSINVRSAILSMDDMEHLVDGARRSTNLTRFSATVDEHWYWHTRNMLTELDHARNAAFAEIQECVARNVSLVQAAVAFVLGDRDAVKGARALELMHDHPDVIRVVRERNAVTRGQAREKIAEAFARVCLCSLDEFMRLAGVVRDKVVCLNGQPDAGLGLRDINDYCWLHIRSFLKLGDVVEA